MAQRCKICNHKKLDEINEKLIQTQNIAKIAEGYGVSYDSLYRHAKNHLPSHLAKAKRAEEAAHADNLLDQLNSLQAKALHLLEQAEKTMDFSTALRGVKEARGCIELLAKLQGQLAANQNINVNIHLKETLERVVCVIQEEIQDPVALSRISERLCSVAEGVNNYG